jgi:LDH2 family malate/lactate/ureidoglycolate dehydrogenase
VDPTVEPTVIDSASSVVVVDANASFAALGWQRGRTLLIDKAKSSGIAALSMRNCFHFSALWHEVEELAEAGLVGIAFLNSKSFVAHYGSTDAAQIYGTNPMAFAFPRRPEAGPPLVWDQASAMMARGEISLAQEAGQILPDGCAIDRSGKPTTDPTAALDGAQLTFGGAKGMCIAMMVELLAAGMNGSPLSMDARRTDCDETSASPTCNGEFIIAIDPSKMGLDGDEFYEHSEKLFRTIEELDGAQLPSTGRHAGADRWNVRAESEKNGVEIPSHLWDDIVALEG